MANKETILLLKEANRLRTEALTRIKEISKGDAVIAAGLKKTDGIYKNIVSKLKDINSEIKEQKSINREKLDDLIQQERSIKSFSGLQKSITSIEKKKLSLFADEHSMHQNTKDALNSISQKNQELIQLNKEDLLGRTSIKAEIEQEISALDKKSKKLGVGAKELLSDMKKEYAIADGVSSLTVKQQAFLEKQKEVYDDIKNSIGGVLETASLLASTWKGRVGGAIMGVGFIVDKVGKTVKEMGGSIGAATFSVTALGLVFDDAGGVAKGLAKEMGGLSHVTWQNQLNTNLMASNMGISGDEAAELTGHFAHLNGGSIETAHNLAASTKSLAKAKGLVPAQIMSDLAGSTKEFAEYGKEGGKNIGEAAVAAGQLGVNLSAMTAVTDSLLDFESSITAELELGAMLGKNINLSKARQLAYDGNIRDSVKESLQQMGGIDAFNRMDIYQKRQAASAIGLSVEQLQNMSLHMNELNKDGSIQLGTFDSILESVTAFATTGMGKAIGGAGGLIVALGQSDGLLKSMGINVGGMVKGLAVGAKNLASKGWQMLMGSGATESIASSIGDTVKESVADKAKESVTEKLKETGGEKLDEGLENLQNKMLGGGDEDAPGPTSLMEKIGKIDTKKVLQGAVAMVAVAGAIWIFGKGVQELEKVDDWINVATGLGLFAISMGALGAVGKFAGPGLVALSTGLAALGTAPVLLGLAGVALAAIGLGYALNLAAPAIKEVGTAVTNIFTILSSMDPSTLIGLGFGMISMAAGFIALGASAPMALMAMIPLYTLATMGTKLSTTSTALMGMGSGLSLIATQLDRIDTSKLDALSDFSISASIGTAVTSISDSIGGVIDTIGNAIGVEKLSDYESKMLQGIEKLITAVETNRDVYLDKEKVTTIIKKTGEKQTNNSSFGLAGA